MCVQLLKIKKHGLSTQNQSERRSVLPVCVRYSLLLWLKRQDWQQVTEGRVIRCTVPEGRGVFDDGGTRQHVARAQGWRSPSSTLRMKQTGRTGGGARSETLQACPKWHASSSQAPSLSGSTTAPKRKPYAQMPEPTGETYLIQTTTIYKNISQVN